MHAGDVTPLAAHDRQRFDADGFLVVEQLVAERDLVDLRHAYDELIESGTSAGDRMLGGITRQIMLPSGADPRFDDNPALLAAHTIGESLLDEPVRRVFDMLIFKAPGHPHETPWHQDMAYAGVPTAPAGVRVPPVTLQFWIALDDVDAANGCMHFVPGEHSTLLEHEVASGDHDDPGRLLALVDPAVQLDLGRAVAAPLRAGGCTIHAYGTPHHTPPNRTTDRPRRAYIVNLASESFVESLGRGPLDST